MPGKAQKIEKPTKQNLIKYFMRQPCSFFQALVLIKQAWYYIRYADSLSPHQSVKSEGVMSVSIEKLRKFVAPEIIFGNGSRYLAGEFCKEFIKKAIVYVPGIKVICVSGYTDNHIVHDGILEEGGKFSAKALLTAGACQNGQERSGPARSVLGMIIFLPWPGSFLQS